MSATFDYYLCGVCGTQSMSSGTCVACGASDIMVAVKAGYLAEFPAGSVPCPSCGSTARPLVLRGWARVVGFLWWTREKRTSSYICKGCARDQTTATLLLNALIGWWSIPSFFFYGWRATYHNWRSIWAPPGAPHKWGAISGVEFAASLRETHERTVREANQQWLSHDAPLGSLNDTQIALVLEARDLYELFGVDRGANLDTIRRAYREQSKACHPDLHQGTARDSTEQMIRLNQAWEVLRSPAMRSAYDYLQDQRTEQAVA